MIYHLPSKPIYALLSTFYQLLTLCSEIHHLPSKPIYALLSTFYQLPFCIEFTLYALRYMFYHPHSTLYVLPGTPFNLRSTIYHLPSNPIYALICTFYQLLALRSMIYHLPSKPIYALLSVLPVSYRTVVELSNYR